MLTRILAFFAAAFFACGAYAQANVQAQARNLDSGTLITLTAATAGTANSSDVNNYNALNAICTMNLTALPSTPSVSFSIQGKDPASGNYYNMITSGAVTTSAPVAIAAGTGVATTANVGVGLPMPKVWRVSRFIGGAGSATGTVRCIIN